jgi:hypothetical protein
VATFVAMQSACHSHKVYLSKYNLRGTSDNG